MCGILLLSIIVRWIAPQAVDDSTADSHESRQAEGMPGLIAGGRPLWKAALAARGLAESVMRGSVNGSESNAK